MLTRLDYGNILQCISNHHIIHAKDIQFLFVNNTLVKLGVLYASQAMKKNSKTEHILFASCFLWE